MFLNIKNFVGLDNLDSSWRREGLRYGENGGKTTLFKCIAGLENTMTYHLQLWKTKEFLQVIFKLSLSSKITGNEYDYYVMLEILSSKI
jgi:hypothetical protein